MTIGTNFVRSFNPIWSNVDLVGNLFDDTFYLWTLTNTIPYIPQAVYHDVSGLIPWTDPIQYLANGTLPVDIYWDETLVYRLEFRQHVGLGPPTQADPLIYVVENYIPTGNFITPNNVEGTLTDNQISNPQFSTISFPTPTLTITGLSAPTSVMIAPGWYLDLNGSGTVVVSQVALNTSQSNPTNAPYALQLNITGPWNVQPILRQRFQQNGQNWQGKYLSTSITGLVQGVSQPITVNLVASNGQPLGQLLNGLLTNNFTELTGVALIPPYANLNIPPAAYIDYRIILPSAGDIYLTSIQLVEGSANITYEYQQDTIDRQIDHLFHYYYPQLAYKPIPSYLVGWDFALNPAQFGATGGPTASGNNTSNYAWDQTILFQSKNSGLNYLRGNDGSFFVQASVSNSQGAIVQYLSGIDVLNMLENPLCAWLRVQTSTPLNVTVSLWFTTGSALPDMNSNNSIVATLNPDGSVATTNPPTGGTWIQIPNVKLGVQTVRTTGSAASFDEFSLNGWQAALSTISGATFFAIVVGFEELPSSVLPDYILFDSIAVQAGNIATRPAPQTYQQVLTDCEYFYEKSWENATAVGTTTNVGSRVNPQGILQGPGGTFYTFFCANAFDLQFRTAKRVPVNASLYSPSGGTQGTVDIRVFQPGGLTAGGSTTFATYWTQAYNGTKSNMYVPTLNPSADIGITTWGSSYIQYQFYADARLGIV